MCTRNIALNMNHSRCVPVAGQLMHGCQRVFLQQPRGIFHLYLGMFVSFLIFVDKA